jgi:hypothetical protein
MLCVSVKLNETHPNRNESLYGKHKGPTNYRYYGIKSMLHFVIQVAGTFCSWSSLWKLISLISFWNPKYTNSAVDPSFTLYSSTDESLRITGRNVHHIKVIFMFQLGWTRQRKHSKTLCNGRLVICSTINISSPFPSHWFEQVCSATADRITCSLSDLKNAK